MPKTSVDVNGRNLAHHLSVRTTYSLSIALSKPVVAKNLVGVIKNPTDLVECLSVALAEARAEVVGRKLRECPTVSSFDLILGRV
jgi:hypothetical protein